MHSARLNPFSFFPPALAVPSRVLEYRACLLGSSLLKSGGGNLVVLEGRVGFYLGLGGNSWVLVRRGQGGDEGS